MAIFWLCPHMVEGAREFFGVSFIRTPIPLMRAPPLGPNHPPKAPSPHTITPGVRASTYRFGGRHKVQTTADKEALLREWHLQKDLKKVRELSMKTFREEHPRQPHRGHTSRNEPKES